MFYLSTESRERERASSSQIYCTSTGSSDRKRGWEEAGEVERERERGGTDDTVYPHRGRSRNMKTDGENGEQTKSLNRQEI